MDRTTANSGTRAVDRRLAFDTAALERWMAANVADFTGPLGVSQFKGGQSNPTYRLDTPARSYVLRRKPPGPLLPGAHAVEREARVMAALGPTGFPVPHIHGLCDDEGIIGTAFFVMDMVEGRIVWDPTFPGLTPAKRAAHFDAMNATIASLHSIDSGEIGLADYGRPSNFVERQVARWSKQYESDVEAGRVPAMDRLVEWLRANLPPDSGIARIVHGDFRCDNMIFAADDPRVIAVLDWELSTIGHPIADIAYNGFIWRSHSPGWGSLDGIDFATSGIPTEADYVAAYCRRTGREAIADWPFYMAFGIFRLASISQGVYRRVLAGNAATEGREAINGAGALAEQALAILEGRE